MKLNPIKDLVIPLPIFYLSKNCARIEQHEKDSIINTLSGEILGQRKFGTIAAKWKKSPN